MQRPSHVSPLTPSLLTARASKKGRKREGVRSTRGTRRAMCLLTAGLQRKWDVAYSGTGVGRYRGHRLYVAQLQRPG